MIKASDLIDLWWSAVWDKWGYIWGRYGQIWTKANQAAATREQTVRWGEKWIGHHVADCSGLTYWAFVTLTNNYGSGVNVRIERFNGGITV